MSKQRVRQVYVSSHFLFRVLLSFIINSSLHTASRLDRTQRTIYTHQAPHQYSKDSLPPRHPPYPTKPLELASLINLVTLSFHEHLAFLPSNSNYTNLHTHSIQHTMSTLSLPAGARPTLSRNVSDASTRSVRRVEKDDSLTPLTRSRRNSESSINNEAIVAAAVPTSPAEIPQQTKSAQRDKSSDSRLIPTGAVEYIPLSPTHTIPAF